MYFISVQPRLSNLTNIYFVCYRYAQLFQLPVSIKNRVRDVNHVAARAGSIMRRRLKEGSSLGFIINSEREVPVVAPARHGCSSYAKSFRLNQHIIVRFVMYGTRGIDKIGRGGGKGKHSCGDQTEDSTVSCFLIRLVYSSFQILEVLVSTE